MKKEMFYDLTGVFLDDCMEIMKSKGASYSGLEDKLGNFKRVAKNLAMSPEQVWFVYFSKHFDALSAYIRGEYSDSEPITGRIMDMVNYLLLLNGLLVEEKRKGCGASASGSYVSGTDYEGRVIVTDGKADGEEKKNCK